LLGWHMGKPEMVEVTDVKVHSSNHRTFTLDKKVKARAGQFAMLWIPGVNEKPMSFSKVSGNVEFTVKKVGNFTAHLFMKGAGDKIGFRGPYGRGFEYVAGNICLVGGGCGVASLKPLAEKLHGDVIVSAKSEEELLFLDDFEGAGFDVHPVTDDGSKGVKGLPHEVLNGLLESKSFKCVYVCGPELMMKKCWEVCMQHKVQVQLSLERYMKCGIGLCGSCTLSGLRVCVEGPVFSGDQLEGTEFGVYGKDGSGSKRRLADGCA